MTSCIVAFVIIFVILRMSLKRYLREAAFDVRGRAMVLGRIITYPGKKDSGRDIIKLRTSLGYNLVRSYNELSKLGIEVEDVHGFVDKRVREHRIWLITLDTLATLTGCQDELRGRIMEISKGHLFGLDGCQIKLGAEGTFVAYMGKNNRLHGSAAIEFEKLNKQYQEILKKTG